MAQKVQKAKYWTAVLYPECMVDNWEEKICDILQLPFAYCIHDRDLQGHKIEKTVKNKFNQDITYCFDDEPEKARKVHVHVVIAFLNTTTYKHALSLFKLLQPNIQYCEQVLNIRYIYNYLIHDTDKARKDNKFQYSINDRICGNGFDIGAYEQVSLTDKRNMLRQLCDYVVAERITNFTVFYECAFDRFGSDYFEVLCTYSGFIERLCKGNYLIVNREKFSSFIDR